MQQFLSLLENPQVRVAIISVVSVLLLQLFKWKVFTKELNDHKLFLNGCVVAIVAISALIADWLPDNKLTLDTWWALAWQGLLGAEFSYQWVLKRIGAFQPTKE